jgi:Tol biopolymer transport system component
MQNSQRIPIAMRRRLGSRQVSELVVIDAGGGNRQVIYEVAELIEAPNCTPDGRCLNFNAEGRLFRISADGSDGPHRINTAPIENANNDHCLSPDGRLIYISARDRHIHVVGIEGGAPRRVTSDQAPERDYIYYLHGVSPDGAVLAYVGYEKGRSLTRICTVPAAGGAIAELTDGSCMVDGPEFSPDGRWIYFNSEAAAERPGHMQIFRIRPDGSGQEQITRDPRVNWFPHFSPDGTMIAYLSYPEGTTGHPADREVLIRLIDPDGGNMRQIDGFVGGQGTINVNSWAPDSRRLAYVAYPDYP